MTALLPANLKQASGLLKVPPNYHFLCRGHGGMCFKMDLRSDSHSHPAHLSLSASLAILSSLLLSSCFFLFNGSHMSGNRLWHRGDDLRSSHAGSPRVRSQCSAYSTQSWLCANPPVQTAPTPDARSLRYWGGNYCDVFFGSLQIQILFKYFYPQNRTTKNSYNWHFENISLTPVGL